MVQIDPDSDYSMIDLIKLADAAMYEDKRAKAPGANKNVIFSLK
jgi:hypothetical protein